MKKLFTILLVLITSIGYSQTIDTVKVILPGGGSTIDTLPLSQRIDTNTVHIATNTTNIASNTNAIAGKENSLGNPSTNGYVLSSTTAGARSWVPNGSGSSGTVTSVGSGYGITGGAITTSGTLTLDSATVSNYYVRRKDSTISFITPTQFALKANDANVVHITGNESISGNKTFLGKTQVTLGDAGSGSLTFLSSDGHVVGNISNGNSSSFPVFNLVGKYGSNDVISIASVSALMGQIYAPSGVVFKTTSGEVARTTTKGISIGTTSSSAELVLGAGTSSASGAPLKILPGLKLTFPEPGAIESDTTGSGVNHLLWTDAYGTRYQLDRPLYSSLSGTIPTWNQNTTGTASNLSGTPALNNGITATTQATTDSSNLLATTAFVKTAPIKAAQITGVIDTSHLGKVVVTLKDPLQINATKDTMSIRKAYYDSLYSGAKTLQQITDSGSVTTHKITAANLNLTGIQEFANQHAAVLGGLSNGDVFKIPADANGNHLLAIVDSTVAGLTFTVDNTSGTNSVNNLYFDGSSNFSMNINWGDGSINYYTGANSYDIHHTYSSSASFNVTVTSPNYSTITTIDFNYDRAQVEKITNLTDFSLFTNLEELDINKCGLTSVDAMVIPNSVQHWDIGNSPITSFNRSLPTSLQYFAFSYSDVASFTATNYPSSITSFYINADDLTTTDVNGILVGLDGAVSGAITVNTAGQSTSAPPSGAGATAKASLISKGGTITTD